MQKKKWKFSLNGNESQIETKGEKKKICWWFILFALSKAREKKIKYKWWGKKTHKQTQLLNDIEFEEEERRKKCFRKPYALQSNKLKMDTRKIGKIYLRENSLANQRVVHFFFFESQVIQMRQAEKDRVGRKRERQREKKQKKMRIMTAKNKSIKFGWFSFGYCYCCCCYWLPPYS